MKYSNAALAFIKVWSLTFAVTHAAAAEMKLPSGPYPYVVVQQDLPSILKAFEQNLGIKVSVSSKVKGLVPAMSAQDFLDYICKSYNLDWYYDGAILYISASSEESTRFIQLGGFTYATLIEAMKKLSLIDSRFTLKPGPEGKSVIVTGPPRYVDVTIQILASLPNPDAVVIADIPSQTTVYRASTVSSVKFGPDEKPGQ
jgi:type III secretion protein C